MVVVCDQCGGTVPVTMVDGGVRDLLCYVDVMHHECDLRGTGRDPAEKDMKFSEGFYYNVTVVGYDGEPETKFTGLKFIGEVEGEGGPQLVSTRPISIRKIASPLSFTRARSSRRWWRDRVCALRRCVANRPRSSLPPNRKRLSNGPGRPSMIATKPMRWPLRPS